jgi:two-component system, OmpR family, sensor histidine kinase KdpD
MSSSSDSRPDPDKLLAKLRGSDKQAARGKLRIYFGANAGVGKTFAMLSAAQRELKLGVKVLVGVIETHGRSETAALLTGLEQLPLKDVPYRGNSLKEFDLDAALLCKPDVVLVDELAHSNADGSRHAKRYQDVQELLDAGIDVWTALNVQHLESLNGTVGSITGVRVHETVPDTVLDDADELVLIDVTPDELLQRLKAGKVYLPQQAERAAKNFFRKGNLIALREIALRRTAEHVEDDVRTYRVEKSIDRVWNTEGTLLVGIGPSEGCEQAVRAAARLASQLNVRWHAAYVETPKLQRLDAPSRDRILAVIKLAEELGAGTAVITHSDAALALIEQAQLLNCATLVMGRSHPGGWAAWAQLGRSRATAQRIASLAPALTIIEVGHSSSTRKLVPVGQASVDNGPAQTLQASLPRYVWATAAVVTVTVLAFPLFRVFDLANIVMLFLLATVLVAVKLGRGPAAWAAMLNVVAFDYFFVTPRFSFAVSDAQYLLTFGVMLAVGLITGQLTAGLQFQARIASSRERRAQSLFVLTRDLSAALTSAQVVELGQAALQRDFGGSALVLAMNDKDQLPVANQVPVDFDASVADWAFRNAQPAGLNTHTLSAQTWHYLPLKATMRVRGVLAIKPAHPRWLLIPEQVQQLDTLARQIAIALERVHYVEIAQQSMVQMESERLKSTLLAAISHDVRTPLTALIGLAESMQRASPPLPAAQADMASAMTTQARELSALVTNLLDMARLQNGSVSLRKEWHSPQEVVGSSIRAAQHALQGHAVQTDVPADLPLVEFDAALIERVLVNLLENAAKYGAAPIAVSARVTPDALVLAVRDHGPGLPQTLKGHEATLFDKFTRGDAESATPGVGLGLAICKAVVDAHGGQISAVNAPGGGAEFSVVLPRRAPPALEHP